MTWRKRPDLDNGPGKASPERQLLSKDARGRSGRRNSRSSDPRQVPGRERPEGPGRNVGKGRLKGGDESQSPFGEW